MSTTTNMSSNTTTTPTWTHPLSINLPAFQSPPSTSPKEVAQNWLSDFATVLASNDVSLLPSVFHEDCWWRDACALSWDLRTLHGIPKLSAFLSPRLGALEFRDLKLREAGAFTPFKTAISGDLEWVESFFTFETAVGSGKGVLRLTWDGQDQKWKAYVVYTTLHEIRGHEWKMGANRPHGGKNTLEGDMKKGNWQERRERKMEFLDEEPTVLCVGAGQSGLNIAARLQTLGVSCLLVDRNERIGDNWRLRYRTLVTHDPVHTCHMPYVPFPPTWSFFTPKDKLAGWFESYASIMELNIWMKTSITSSSYDAGSHTWTVAVKRGDGSTRTIKPHHIIFCTGHSGEPKIPSFPGQSTFKGQVYHGSQHQDASMTGDAKGRRVIVVGTGNSGHDIAQNFHDNGAEVTMLQRRSTHVVTADKGLIMMTDKLFGENSPSTEDADVYGQSFPLPVTFALQRPLIKAIAEVEKETHAGLEAAGFKLNDGMDGGGLFSHYLTRGGGYYIDVGCSQLIVDGKIKVVRSEQGIKGFEPDALVLADGRRVQADVVVLATGYDNMRTSLRKALGDDVADVCKDVWDMDGEGELRAMWRPSGHPGLWYMGGNLSLGRVYSKFLALQIKAVEVGLNKQDYENVAPKL